MRPTRASAALVAICLVVPACSGDDAVAAPLAACVVPTARQVVPAGPAGPLAWQGVDVELLSGVAADLGVDLEVREISRDEAVAAVPLGDGTCEVLVGGVTAGTVTGPLVTEVAYRDDVLLVVSGGERGSASGPFGHVRDPAVREIATARDPDALAFPSLLDATAALANGAVSALVVSPVAADAVVSEVTGAVTIEAVPSGRVVVAVLSGTIAEPRRAAVVEAVEAWAASTAAREAQDRWLLTD